MQRYHQTTLNGGSSRNRKGMKRKTDLVFASDTTMLVAL